MVKERVARMQADRSRTNRARAEETAGEAAARQQEDQHQTAAARQGERGDPVDNEGNVSHNCRDIRPPPPHMVSLWLFYDGTLQYATDSIRVAMSGVCQFCGAKR